MVSSRYSVRCLIYERILNGEPYSDLLERYQSKAMQQDTLDAIKLYRKIEHIDMMNSMRAKTTGLSYGTCQALNIVYERICKQATGKDNICTNK